MQVFKFGGASVKDAESVKNVAEIIKEYGTKPMVVVLSAMGKSTNALENLLELHNSKQSAEFEKKSKAFLAFHSTIYEALFNDEATKSTLKTLGEKLLNDAFNSSNLNTDQKYSKTVAIGELYSSHILYEYLKSLEIKCHLLDARSCIRTANKTVSADVNWTETEELIKTNFHSNAVNVVQGFIASDGFKNTTTLGREGSDFTAAIMAYCLNAESVSIWKDVPGLLDADPKWFDDTRLIPSISYKEATELAYYGASVIHPKTLKPLQNKGIALYVKSFLKPEDSGSTIHSSENNDSLIPSFIFKMDQVLVSITARDFSFIDEANLAELFNIFNQRSIRVNLMQNTALTFSICIDNNNKWEALLDDLSNKYKVLYNKGLELATVRHYNQQTIERIMTNKKLLLEQRTRNTLQFVLEDLG